MSSSPACERYVRTICGAKKKTSRNSAGAAMQTVVSAYLSHASDELVAYSVRAFRHYGISYLLVGFNVVIGGFLTALERPIPAISISVGRGLVLQSAVLLALAALFGGEALWYTPIISEALCLAMSVIFLRLYQRETRV